MLLKNTAIFITVIAKCRKIVIELVEGDCTFFAHEGDNWRQRQLSMVLLTGKEFTSAT